MCVGSYMNLSAHMDVSPFEIKKFLAVKLA